MRAAESYRPARRNLARLMRLPWADLPRKANVVQVPKLRDRLVGAAIMRGKQILHVEQGSHQQARGFKDPMPGDKEGFMTMGGYFVDRRAAAGIAVLCGQLPKNWNMDRKLLSADINWDGQIDGK